MRKVAKKQATIKNQSFNRIVNRQLVRLDFLNINFDFKISTLTLYVCIE